MKFLIILLAAVLLMFTVVPVIKVNAQDPNISNSPGSYAFGTLDASSSYQTGLDYFTVTNNSTYPVKISIRGSDMTGGSVNWTLSDNAMPGPDTYGLKAGLDGDGVSYNITVTKNNNILIDNLADNISQRWGLELWSPTSFSDGVLKSGTVTLTAAAI